MFTLNFIDLFSMQIKDMNRKRIFHPKKQNHKQCFCVYQGYNELDKHICHYFFSKRLMNLAQID